MNKHEALIEMAIQRGVDPSIANAALNSADRASVAILLEQIQKASDSVFIFNKYVEEIINTADSQGQLPELTDLLLIFPHNSLGSLASRLSKYPPHSNLISLLRQMTELDWASEQGRYYGAEAVFETVYRFSEKALDDETSLVRIVAARHFEKEQNIEALIKALANEIHAVRQLAAWYMGRKQVQNSADILNHLLVNEADTETLRAMIWSLGVLRAFKAKGAITALTEHEHPLIASTARQTLRNLE